MTNVDQCEVNKNLATKINVIGPKNVSLNINKLKNLLGSKLKVYNLKDGLSYMKENPI